MSKYSQSDQSSKFPSEEYLEIGADGGKKVKFFEDGSIEATAFRDGTDSGLTRSETPNKNVFFEKKLKEDTSLIYMPNNWSILYKYVCKKIFSLKGAFAKVNYAVKKFNVLDLGRFKHAHKSLRKAIKKLLKEHKRFVFARETDIGIFTEPYKKSKTFGPYNVPVQIKTEQDIDFINDLIVIKTGCMSLGRMVNEAVTYVSPHILKMSSGTFHTSTGVKSADGTTPATGIDVNVGLHSGEVLRATSDNFSIPKNSTLSSNTKYMYYSDGGSATQEYTELETDLLDTLFHALYPEENIQGERWDGIVPSGGYVRIESWSTNDQFCGFDGELSIVPVDESLASSVDITYASEASAVSPSYQESVKIATKKAEKKFYDKVGKTLIDLGYKHNSCGLRRFESLLSDVATGKYDPGKNQRVQTDLRLAMHNPQLVDFMFPFAQQEPFTPAKEVIWVSSIEGINNLGKEGTAGGATSSSNSSSNSSSGGSSTSSSSGY